MGSAVSTESDYDLESMKEKGGLYAMSDSDLSALIEERALSIDDVKKKATQQRKASNEDDLEYYATIVPDSDETMLAVRLNTLSTAIADLRFKMVPGRMKESAFWKAVFDLLGEGQNGSSGSGRKSSGNADEKYVFEGGKGNAINQSDVDSNIIPMLPRNGKVLLLDIEGVICSVAFGKKWEKGFKGKNRLYPDLIPMLDWCRNQGIEVYTFSNAPIDAQKSLFGNTIYGNLKNYFSGHFDTTGAGKTIAKSYRSIANSVKAYPSYITFMSDSEAELTAAKEAGICNLIMCIRPGNQPLTPIAHTFPAVHSLMQVCGI